MSKRKLLDIEKHLGVDLSKLTPAVRLVVVNAISGTLTFATRSVCGDGLSPHQDLLDNHGHALMNEADALHKKYPASMVSSGVLKSAEER